MLSVYLLSTFVPLAFAIGVWFGIQHQKAEFHRRSARLIEGEVVDDKKD